MATTSKQTPTVREATSYLKRLSRGRSSSTVNATDVHRFLDRKKVSRNPLIRLSFINKVLNPYTQSIFRVGTVVNTRPAARGRKITEWMFA